MSDRAILSFDVLVLDYRGLCRKDSRGSSCQKYLKDDLRRKGHYAEEVSLAGWRRPKPGIAPGGRLEQDRYLSDATRNRNSHLSLIKPLPVPSEGNGSLGSNRKEVSASAVNLLSFWDRHITCAWFDNRHHPMRRFWL